jgi:PAS domain S-box-containing protein
MTLENGDDLLRRAAQARLAAIVESSDDAIVSKTLEGVIQTWNKGAERIFGWTSDEVVGKLITVIIPPDRLDEEPEILSRLRRGERVDHFETIRMTKDGRLISVSVTISPVRDETGRIIGASKIARDITAQKQFEGELKRAKEAAETANRAKDHFLSVLSHELRTPLTPVLGAISLLEGSPDLTAEDLREHLSMIRRNIETEARLIDDLLDLTRIARGKLQLHFEIVDAHAVVRNTVSMLQSELDAKDLAVTVALRAKSFQVWADPGRFQQMLLNLLSNAIKFTPADGSITVRTSNENGTVKIEVIDTGIGIEPEVLPRMFNAFEQGQQTVRRQFGGVGLGLSIVKSLIGMHKGSVSASSEGTGRGATFTLRLDTVTSPPLTGGGALSAGPAREKLPLRILLVEDHDDTRNVMTRLLRSFGCNVTAAGSVSEAMAIADRQEFDLLVSDIGLPDGSGMDVMRRLSAMQQVKGIAITGFGQDDDLRRSMEAGFATHLTKPVNFQTLHDAIQKVTRKGSP